MDDEFGDMGPPPDKDLDYQRRKNNPRNEPTGDYTGRCMKCGSKNLWTDNLSYGCKDCGEIYIRS
jgi:hypothetical protein